MTRAERIEAAARALVDYCDPKYDGWDAEGTQKYDALRAALAEPQGDAGCRCGKFGVSSGMATSDGRILHTRDRCEPIGGEIVATYPDGRKRKFLATVEICRTCAKFGGEGRVYVDEDGPSVVCPECHGTGRAAPTQDPG